MVYNFSVVKCLKFFFFKRGLITAVFGACGKTPERRDAFTICRRSEVMQFDTPLKRPVGRISRQQEEDFKCCIMSSKVLWLIT